MKFSSFILVVLGLVLPACALTWERRSHLECTADDQCSTGEKCLFREETNYDYYDGSTSTYRYGSCASDDACYQTADCDDGLVCRYDGSTSYGSYDSRCVEPSCREGADCAPFGCDIEHGLCFEYCDGAQACAPGFSCLYNECKAGSPTGSVCSADSECATGFCNEGYCRESCEDVSAQCGDYQGVDCGGCPSTEYCEANRCVTKLGYDEYCTEDDQCSTGYCDGYFASCGYPLSVGEFCGRSGECATGYCCVDVWGDYVCTASEREECTP